MNGRAFWIDHVYDRENADTGTTSRYGNYLRLDRHRFAEIWYDDPRGRSVEFASIAWRIARGPVMSPPYVRSRDRVLSAEVSRNDWDGSLIASVELVADRPQAVRAPRPTLADTRYYADWQHNSTFGYEDVSGEDLTRRPYLLTTIRLLTPVPTDTLPAFDTEADTRLHVIQAKAADAVAALVTLLNREITPVIEALEAGHG